MCTPRYDVTLGRFMGVAHPLPRRRGNHTFVNALPWMCRTGAPWRGLPECCGKWVTVYRRFDRWSGDGAMERLFTALREERVIGAEIRSSRHGLHERGGPPARGRGAEEGGSRPVGAPAGGGGTWSNASSTA